MLPFILGGISTGMAPFNVPPSAAFLTTIGLNVGPLPLVAHFGYGAFWGVVFVALFGTSVDWGRGLLLAAGLWLFMMLVYSPVIGWGVFGVGGAAHDLSPDAPRYLGSSMKYIVATLVIHLVYGGVLGSVMPRALSREELQAA
jgi:hypothetical protein